MITVRLKKENQATKEKQRKKIDWKDKGQMKELRINEFQNKGIDLLKSDGHQVIETINK